MVYYSISRLAYLCTEWSHTYVEALKVGHFEILLRSLTQVHQLSHFGLIIQFRLHTVVAGKPEAVIAEDAWSSHRRVDGLYALGR